MSLTFPSKSERRNERRRIEAEAEDQRRHEAALEAARLDDLPLSMLLLECEMDGEVREGSKLHALLARIVAMLEPEA